ncbi:MAG: hypothetical protein IID41_09265, partial [Planctomycetes bacterium]|nr:hypothetical protein [Planctomycetota bacterium]
GVNAGSAYFFGGLGDCNANGIPDECDIAECMGEPACSDCNGNGVPDECDIAEGRSADADGGGVPDECEAEVLFVKADAGGLNHGTSWDDAYTDLQSALTVAANPDNTVTQIWVAQGTYAPSELTDPKDARSATFQLQNNLALYGGFAGFESTLEERVGLFDQTILTGDLNGNDGPQLLPEFVACFSGADVPLEPGCEEFDIDGDDDVDFDDLELFLVDNNYAENSYHVTTGSGTDLMAILDGFTITAGNADGAFPEDDRGGGMYNLAGNPTVANCTFSGNAADLGAGMLNNNSSPEVTDCTLSGNIANASGGGMHNFESSPLVSDCAFIGNAANLGGGMRNNSSSLVVTGCTFSGNSAATHGGGMVNINLRNTNVTNCTFSGNTAGSSGGGMRNNLSSPVVTGCTFSGNSALFGGGMTNADNSSTKVTNCTFTANSADFRGGGMRNNNSSPAVIGCTFSENSANFGGGMDNEMSSGPHVTNCTFSGNTAIFNGGGMNNNGSSPTVINCTFSGNSAEDSGGGMRNQNNSTSVIANSIFWGNTDTGGTNMDESAQISSDGTSSATVDFSDIQGLTGALGGLGNLGLDPLFFDPDGPDDEVGTEDDNLRLLHGSPVIDAGQNAAVPQDTPDLDGDGDTGESIPFDLDGEARFVDDVLTPDCPQADKDPKVDCGIAPIVDMGAYEFEPDCDGNEIPDKCDNDCGEEGGPCDVPGCGQIVDCNGNGVPDECEADCNDNGVPDDCDVTDGTSEDCNDSAVPDECEIASGDSADCNENSIPDECEGDCNGNGQPDDCDVIEGFSEDCNDNIVPDECEVDCNDSGQPDDCDVADGSSEDCNSNNIPDECDLDCNENGQPDDCDIADGFSADCSGNGIPDECEPDCNRNNEADSCDIADGSSGDCNGNGIPDECPGEPPGPPITQQPVSQEVEVGGFAFFQVQADGGLLEYQWRKDRVDLIDSERILGSQATLLIIIDVVPEDAGEYDCVVTSVFPSGCSTSDAATLTVTAGCPADMNDDGVVGPVDLAMLLAAWGPCADSADCPADLNADAAVGPLDLAQLLAAWGECP